MKAYHYLNFRLATTFNSKFLRKLAILRKITAKVSKFEKHDLKNLKKWIEMILFNNLEKLVRFLTDLKVGNKKIKRIVIKLFQK